MSTSKNGKKPTGTPGKKSPKLSDELRCRHPAWKRLKSPVVASAYKTGGFVRHAVEAGMTVVTTTLATTEIETNPTQITACGLASMEIYDTPIRDSLAKERWCEECRKAVELMFIRQELERR